MKKKLKFEVFAISLFIVACLFVFFVYMGYLDEIQIKNVVNNYFSTLSEGRYELAKNYCVPDGEFCKFADFVKNQHEEIGPFYNPIIVPHIIGCYTGMSNNFVEVELVITASALGTNLRQMDKIFMFLAKEKSGLLGAWKLK